MILPALDLIVTKCLIDEAVVARITEKCKLDFKIIPVICLPFLSDLPV